MTDGTENPETAVAKGPKAPVQKTGKPPLVGKWLKATICLQAFWLILLICTFLDDFASPSPLLQKIFWAASALAVINLLCFYQWHKARKNRGVVIVHSYPEFVYVWPVVILGPIFYYLNLDSALAGWIYLTVVATVLVTMGYDLNRNYSIFWLLLVSFIWVVCLWLRSARNVLFFEELSRTIGNFPMKYSPTLGLGLSVVVGVIYLIMLIEVRINQRWRISHNEIEHRNLGFSDDSLARGAKGVKATYPDVLELLILGSGTLSIYSAQGNKLLRQISNIPFLIFRMHRISAILEAMAVTSDEAEGEDHDGEADPGEEGVHG